MAASESDQVANFLKENRGVCREIYEKFRSEKMDFAAVREAKDEELQALGLLRRGDLLALKAFAERDGADTEADRGGKKRKLLEALKAKIVGKGSTKKKKTFPQKPQALQKISSRKVHVGWQHFDKKQNRYVSVRLVNGGGTRDITVAINATKEDIINEMKDVFFADGKCVYGEISNMQISLGNFKCEEVIEDGFTLSQYIARYKLSKCRLYLLSKLNEEVFSVDDSEESEDDLPPSFLGDTACGSPTETTSSSLIGTSSERTNLLKQRNSEFLDSLAKDQERDVQMKETLTKQRERALEEENLCKNRAANVPAEPAIDEPHVKISVRHVKLGIQARRFSSSCQISSIYDWVGSLCIHPAYFTLSTCDIASLDPTLPVTLVDKTLVSMAAMQEDTGFIDFTTDLTPSSVTESFQRMPVFSIPIPTELPPEILLEEYDRFQAHCDNESESFSLHQEDDNTNNITQDTTVQKRILKIRRVNLMQDMIEIFKDETIMTSPIKVKMVNGFGNEEEGVDNQGVFRDALSAFWATFYNSCTIGEEERAPIVRHDFQVDEWQAISRILVKGYREVKFFPVKLNRVFMFATLFNEKEIQDELLIESFLSYISHDERVLVSSVLKATELQEDQQEEWLDFLDRFGCRKIPKVDERLTVLHELAHKEMVQVAQYIIDSWKEPCKQLTTCAGISSGDELMLLYRNAQPTVKRVLGLIEATPASNCQRDALSYLKRFIRGLDEERLVKFLRFCTGATMVCIDRILVTFTDLDGMARRPVAHTCGSVLQLPTTYQSFPQFREEMNNILSSDYWDIDIL